MAVDGGVVCRDLRFSYGRNRVLRGLNWESGPGLVGILGPNGAGKSTLFSVLTTLRRPSSGSVIVLGEDLATADGRKAVRRSLGFLPQAFGVARYRSVESNVRYAAWAQGIDWRDTARAAGAAIDLVGLTDKLKVRAGNLSGGYRQRLGLACATVHRPRVLLLDEPTVGLDPVNRISIRKLMHSISRHALVLVTTHMVEDLALTADQVAVINDGRIVFSNTVEALSRLGQTGGAASSLENGYAKVLDQQL